MKYKIPVMILLILLLAGGFYWKRIYALITGSCYIEVGGKPLLLNGITSQCFIQNFGEDKLWVFVSERNIFFAICGKELRNTKPMNIPMWGYNFVRIEKGVGEPFIYLNWHEVCERDVSFWDGKEKRDYVKNTARYLIDIPWGGGTLHDLEDLIRVEKMIEAEYIDSDQQVMSKKELDALVKKYRNWKND